MKWHDMLSDGYGRILEIMERTCNGLSTEDLKWQPHPDANSIGWLCWHLTRGQDGQIAALMGEEELWIKDGWHAKFNRPADTGDRGFGHTSEQVAAFEPQDAETLLEYLRATTERSKAYFLTLSEADLDRELNEPRWTPLPTVGVRIVSIMSDNLQHAGQASYVRGMLQGKGWQGF
ncbi:DinB family protein [Chloroflexota bacterium]